MECRNKRHKIIHDVAEVLGKRYSNSNFYLVLWIMLRYFHYAIEAVINGYVIKIYYNLPIAKMELVYISAEVMKKRKRKLFMLSHKSFGQMFSFSITGKYFKNELYNFFVSPEIRKRIQEKLDSDTIYQFVKS